MTRLNELTTESLGAEATEQDLEAFRAAVRIVMDRDGLDETEAVEWLWGNGDYYARLPEEIKASFYPA